MRSAMPASSATWTKISGSSGKGRVEEGEAASVGGEPALACPPARASGAPARSARAFPASAAGLFQSILDEREETGVEPRAQEMVQVHIHFLAGPASSSLDRAKQLCAHRDDGARAPRRHVHAPDQLLPLRLRSPAVKPSSVVEAGQFLAIGLDGRLDFDRGRGRTPAAASRRSFAALRLPSSSGTASTSSRASAVPDASPRVERRSRVERLDRAYAGARGRAAGHARHPRSTLSS